MGVAVALKASAGSRPKFILITSQKSAPVTNPNATWFSTLPINWRCLSSECCSVCVVIDRKAALTCNAIQRHFLNLFQPQKSKITHACRLCNKCRRLGCLSHHVTRFKRSSSLSSRRGWFEYSIPKPDIIIFTSEIEKTNINIISLRTTAAVWSECLFRFSPPMITNKMATSSYKTKHNPWIFEYNVRVSVCKLCRKVLRVRLRWTVVQKQRILQLSDQNMI